MSADLALTAGTPPQVGSPSGGVPPTNPQARITAFRIATQEQSENIGQTSLQLTTAEQVVENQMPQTGLLYGFHLDVNNVTSANAAGTAFFEDGPWSALSSIILRDVNVSITDMDGFSMRMLNLYGAWQAFDFNTSADTLLKVTTTGAGGTGGSFRFPLFVPVAINRRTLQGVLGNQDRSQAYLLRHNYQSGAGSASGPIYTTAPTTQGTMVVTRHMERYAVPAPVADNGGQNQVVPSHYGIIPYNQKNVLSELPASGQITHFLHRLGNVHRVIVLIARSNGLRATAESNLPTNLQYKIGNQVRFNESMAYRRALMFERYGFDAPQGLIVYDEMHDFAFRSGTEMGNDWLWSQAVTQLQFLITWPAGIGSTNNSLTALTSELAIPPNINPYA